MPEGRPLVSVIVPTYDRRELLRDAVESALGQTYSPVEVIVVKNGNAPGAAEALASRREEIRYFEIPEPGLSGARNFGIRQARGEFVALLDDDDLWRPEKLERQMAAFAGNPAAVLCYCDSYLFQEPGAASGRYSALYPPRRGRVLKELVRESFAVCSTLVFRRSALDRAGLFEPRYQISEEYDLMLRLAPLGEFEYVDEPLVWYRFHPGNDSRRRRSRMWEEFTEVLENALRRNPELMRESPGLCRDRLAESYFHLGVSRLREGAGGGAGALAKALGFGPHRVARAAARWVEIFLRRRRQREGRSA